MPVCAVPVSAMPYELPVECATEAHEIIQWALLKEKHYPSLRNPQYLGEVQRHGMTATWRLRVCRWMFETAKEFELQMDTVFGALHFLDQYLSVHSVDRVTLQLLGMICMWTASKMHEGKPILLEEMALMCERKFSRAQMVDAEAQLVRLIGFRFNPPNVFTMARDFVNELPFEGDDKDRRANCVASVFNLLERVVEDISSLECSASSLAKAAVQLVAKSEYNFTVPKLLKALKTVQIEERAYRAAFKIVRGAYFGTAANPSRTQTAQAAAPCMMEPLKSLTQSPTAIEQVLDIHDETPSSPSNETDDSYLICTETLSPSPSQASPAPVRTTASTSSTIGITRTAPSPARSETDTDRPNKRQRKVTM
ncbi:G2/Mitotic-specific cyclin A [Phytophthora cinnamomi]|uniref:G2/Mitotic-specific cyclin A n=1 Tax=Phytophthora cinnamomi TaxID=4785 RepID=UPI0035596D9F|nr:G2/Mitotic-specific cyclin A [Phytophthora cinnamomi]